MSVGDSTRRERAYSHKTYLDTLQRPSAAEVSRISSIQLQKEGEIDQKYHTAEERDAAKTIQKAYRGHRERRQLDGLTLDPSSRWLEMIREWRYRSATAPHYGPASPTQNGRPRSASDLAKLHWARVAGIAEHAVAGESPPTADTKDLLPSSHHGEPKPTPTEVSMMMDLRYFLEMVDQKHRYGTNLQIYHEEWLRRQSKQNFFYWLDHGDGLHVNMYLCERAKLDTERIRYLSKDERKDYLVRVDDEGLLRWEKNGELISTNSEDFKDSMHGIVPKTSDEPSFNDDSIKEKLSQDRRFARKLTALQTPALDEPLHACDDDEEGEEEDDELNSSDADDHPESTSPPTTATTQAKPPRRAAFHLSPATVLNRLLRATVKPGTWIYVADTLGRLYVGIKASGAFQHASFLAGARISSAGALGAERGRLTYLSPLSGHYRPTTRSFDAFLAGLRARGVDCARLRVSRAYDVLLGLEYYGRTKEGLHRVAARGRREKGHTPPSGGVEGGVGAERSASVGRHCRDDHTSAPTKLMEHLHIRR